MASGEKGQEVFQNCGVGEGGRSLTEALRDKCLTDTEDVKCQSAMVIKLNITGKPKGTGNAQLGYLRNVVLSGQNISHAGLSDNGLRLLCPNVVDLDLSSNLISSWNEVAMVFGELKQLKYVNLSGNRLNSDVEALRGISVPAVEDLVLNRTKVGWDTVSKVCKCLPAVRELHICHNDYEMVCEESVTALCNVECLRMNNNRIQSWEEIAKFSRLPRLKSFIISDNPLGNIFYRHQPSACQRQDAKSQPIATVSSNIIHNTCSSAKEDNAACDDNTGARGQRMDLTTDTTSCIDSTDDGASCTDKTGASTVCVGSDIESPPSVGKEDDSTGNFTNTDVANHQQSHQDTLPRECVENAASAVCQNILNVVFENVMQRERKCEPGVVSDSELANPAAETNMTAETEVTTQTDATTALHVAPPVDSKTVRVPPMTDTAVEADTVTAAGIEMGTAPTSPPALSIVAPFAMLETLCVSNTLISSLDDIKALSQFPKLHSLRIKTHVIIKFQNKAIVPELSQADRRKILIACLPNVLTLNGSEVSDTERNKSEEHFLRHFKTHTDPPARFAELVEKHGMPHDTAYIDISAGFCEYAEISVIHQNVCVHKFTMHVVQPVRKLRKYIADNVLHQNLHRFRMYHYACGPYHANDTETTFDELILDSMPLSRYNVLPGDEIHTEMRSGGGFAAYKARGLNKY